MNKPKFKMTLDEMIEFNGDCEQTARRCPQYYGEFCVYDGDIFRKEITPIELVNHWASCDVLFGYGYAEELSVATDLVFERYRQYKHDKAVYKDFIKNREEVCDDSQMKKEFNSNNYDIT
jgi:hypothetical protein